MLKKKWFIPHILALFISSAAAAEISLFTVAIQPGWPVFAAPELPSDFKVSGSTKFMWSFPTTPNDQSCQTAGKADVLPCEGRAIDHIFTTAGQHTLQLTITDPSLSKPLVVRKTIEVPDVGKLPLAHRPEVRSLNTTQWQQMVNGLYKLRELGVYDHIARLHKTSFSVGVVSGSGTQRGAAHSSPAFLPWHRASSRVIERCLQEAMKDQTMGLPYWDWRYGWDKMEEYFGYESLNLNAMCSDMCVGDPVTPVTSSPSQMDHSATIHYNLLLQIALSDGSCQMISPTH